ncbi:putative solute carrier family 35 member SLC35F1/F2/F6 [Helianthus anomalus]
MFKATFLFLGAALCVSGLCLVLLSDSGVGGGGGTNPVLGDALVIAGTCFFAFSNVGEVGFHEWHNLRN